MYAEVPVEQAIERFCNYLHRHFGPSSSTLKHYRSDLKIFLEVVCSQLARDITVKDIDRFVEQQMQVGLKPSTINRRLACLRSFFDYLAQEDMSVHWPNPVVWRRHHLKTGSHLPRDLAEGDVARLLGVITDVRDKAIFGLMIGAGLRVGEVVGIQLDHLLIRPKLSKQSYQPIVNW
jgi:site-specific recombinase XerD